MSRSRLSLIFALTLAATAPGSLQAFCGFYVGRADTKLFNKASKVVLVRDGDRTVLTMSNDFEGEAKDFALVVPVPTFLERGQINVGNQASLDHLDAYSAPRLVEYWDEDPCNVRRYERMMPAGAPPPVQSARAKDLGVKIEAQYTVGEYDIVILSADQSDGLETWLIENGYKIPSGATGVLGSYIKQKMRFFVAKVNLAEQKKLGVQLLRPLQIAFESPKFMLPIRLGTVNANGPQELFVFALTKNGRVETTNYRTVKLPTDTDVPLFVKDDFSRFYRDMFAQQVKKEEMHVVFQEYAWDMAWCDPCAAQPLSAGELHQLGVFWVGDEAAGQTQGRARPAPPGGGAVNVFVTRLHLRYDADHFPEDLVFQTTGDRTNFQGRYILRHPWTGSGDCAQANAYRKNLAVRQQTEAETLAKLTGWEIEDIYKKMGGKPSASVGGSKTNPSAKWWENLFGNK